MGGDPDRGRRPFMLGRVAEGRESGGGRLAGRRLPARLTQT